METIEERMAQLEAKVDALLRRLDGAPSAAGAGSQLAVDHASTLWRHNDA